MYMCVYVWTYLSPFMGSSMRPNSRCEDISGCEDEIAETLLCHIYICYVRSMDLRNFTRSRKQLMNPYIAALFIDALLKWVIIHSIHRLARY